MSGIDALVDYPGQRRESVEPDDRVDNHAGKHDVASSGTPRHSTLTTRCVDMGGTWNTDSRSMPPTLPHSM
jgi:hypothetical protein